MGQKSNFNSWRGALVSRDFSLRDSTLSRATLFVLLTLGACNCEGKKKFVPFDVISGDTQGGDTSGDAGQSDSGKLVDAGGPKGCTNREFLNKNIPGAYAIDTVVDDNDLQVFFAAGADIKTQDIFSQSIDGVPSARTRPGRSLGVNAKKDLVVWEDDEGKPPFTDLMVQLGEGSAIKVTDTDDSSEEAASIEALGSDFYIAYRKTRVVEGGTNKVTTRIMKIDSAGQLVDDKEVATGSRGDFAPSIATRAGDLVVVTSSAEDSVRMHVLGTDLQKKSNKGLQLPQNNIKAAILVYHDVGGNLVFEVTNQFGAQAIRAQRLSFADEALGNIKNVTGADEFGSSMRVSAFLSGTAVAYRSRNASTNKVSARVAFIHSNNGNVVAESTFSETDFSSGRMGIGVLSDGTLGIAWTTIENGTSTRVNTAKIDCQKFWLACGDPQ